VVVTNPAPGGGASNSVNFNVSPAASFTLNVGNITIATAPAAAGTMASGSAAITLTPQNGFVGAVTVSCPTTGNLPPGMTCPNVNIPSGTTTGTLTVSVSDPSSSLSAMAAPAKQNLWAANSPANHGDTKAWLTLSGGTGFAAMLLLFLPGRKRYRAALGLGLVCVLSFSMGCSSGGGSGGPVAVATATQVSVTSTKVASGTNIAFGIAVNASIGANGQVQLFDGSAPIGTPVPVVNGSTSISNASLAVGTHSINAHYLGDSKTLASQSGVLFVTVTGTIPAVTITATSGSITATKAISITVN
jgi:hypothetical protein